MYACLARPQFKYASTTTGIWGRGQEEGQWGEEENEKACYLFLTPTTPPQPPMRGVLRVIVIVSSAALCRE